MARHNDFGGKSEIDYRLYQFVARSSAYGPREVQLRLAGIAALAYMRGVELGPDFWALVKGSRREEDLIPDPNPNKPKPGPAWFDKDKPLKSEGDLENL